MMKSRTLEILLRPWRPIDGFIRYLCYTRSKMPSPSLWADICWSVREVYWDYYPDRFHKWYDANIREKYDDNGNRI